MINCISYKYRNEQNVLNLHVFGHFLKHHIMYTKIFQNLFWSHFWTDFHLIKMVKHKKFLNLTVLLNKFIHKGYKFVVAVKTFKLFLLTQIIINWSQHYTNINKYGITSILSFLCLLTTTVLNCRHTVFDHILYWQDWCFIISDPPWAGFQYLLA